MRTAIWILVGGLSLSVGCTMAVADDVDGPADRELGDVGLDGFEDLEVEDCGARPLFELEAVGEFVDYPAAEQLNGWDDDHRSVVVSELPEHGKGRPDGLAQRASEAWLEAYPHFDDCTLPGNACW